MTIGFALTQKGEKMARLYDYCAKCERRIEIGAGEIVFNTYYEGEPLTFCRSCVDIVDVDYVSGIKTERKEEESILERTGN